MVLLSELRKSGAHLQAIVQIPWEVVTYLQGLPSTQQVFCGIYASSLANPELSLPRKRISSRTVSGWQAPSSATWGGFEVSPARYPTWRMEATWRLVCTSFFGYDLLSYWGLWYTVIPKEELHRSLQAGRAHENFLGGMLQVRSLLGSCSWHRIAPSILRHHVYRNPGLRSFQTPLHEHGREKRILVPVPSLSGSRMSCHGFAGNAGF